MPESAATPPRTADIFLFYINVLHAWSGGTPRA
jgi:hypothetical protein